MGRYNTIKYLERQMGGTHTVRGEENAKSILWYLDKTRAYIRGTKCWHRFEYRALAVARYGCANTCKVAVTNE